ncbi:MAG: TonB-dependent receptor, partial [Bacteroidia bacterium]
KGTEKSTTSDLNGFFILDNINDPNLILDIYLIGYKPKSLAINLNEISGSLKIQLEPRPLSLNEVVITGNRQFSRRSESSILVHVLDSKMLELTQSSSLSDGLCFQPGLRMETDCQTCGFSQLRMNGLPGSYSQVLINSRPVFPSLLSMYGLEQFPASLIDRVEVVKGGGSVLYGSSAIAGTVNIITKTPAKNDWSAGISSGIIDGQAIDNNLNASASLVNKSGKAGSTLMFAARQRDEYDANGDSFTELPKIKSASLGFSSFLKTGKTGLLEFQAFNINEERQGGNKIGQRANLADQGEYRLHHVFAADAGYSFESGKNTMIRFYSAAQTTWRSHYTGLDQENGWGLSRSSSFQSGVQIQHQANQFPLGKNTFVLGLENQWDKTFDKIEAYNYLIDQEVTLTGLFIQSDWTIFKNIQLSSGYRLNISNRLTIPIHTPRFALLWKPSSAWQFRGSWSQGFKAPQAFETDMHIAFAGGGVSVISIDPNLKAEFSEGINFSASYSYEKPNYLVGISLDYFRTKLQNNFILEEIGFNNVGNQELFRTNGQGALYEGVTLELRMAWKDDIVFQSGFTLQKAILNEPLNWSSELPGVSRQLRTPNTYGYLNVSAFNDHRLQPSLSVVYTGEMLVPHFGGAPTVPEDELITSESFIDLGLRLNFISKIKIGKKELQLQTGVHNLLNAYQSDFDTGKNRDSNFVYGPMRPRTIYFGIKL